MNAKNLFAAAALALLGATSAFAGTTGPAADYQSPTRFATSSRSRDAVVAEVQNLRSQGQLALGGDVIEAPVAAVAQPAAPVLSRADVRAQVTAAIAAKALPRNGELM